MIDYTQQDQYQVMHGVLNERQWRLYVATEAKRRGPGGISQVAREAGVTRKTIHKGLQELEAGELYEPGVDWYRNILAAGGGTVFWHKKAYTIGKPEPIDAKTALTEFPAFFRLILQRSGTHDFVRVKIIEPSIDTVGKLTT